jgi:hypothetical protein
MPRLNNLDSLKLVMVNLRSTPLYLLLGILNLSILVPQASLDPDPHHDGVMFAAAVAVADGKVPNRDVFAQYGPLAPMIHGQILKIFGVQLLNLRLATAVMLVLTALILFALLRSQVGFKTAFLLQLLWVVSYPKLPLPPLMPWASVICTLLLLAAWSCWKIASNSDTNLFKIRFLYFLSGLTISLAIFVRIQMLFFVLLLVVFILYKSYNRDPLFSQSKYFALGCSILILGFVLWMSNNGSLGDFIEQCITWPREFYGSAYLPTTIFTKDGFIYWSTWYYYPFFFFVAFLLVRLSKKYQGLFILRDRRYGYILWTSTAILAIALSFLGTFEVNPKSYLNPLLQLQWLIEKIPLSLFYFLAALGFIKIVSFLLPGQRSFGFFEITIIGAAIAQLYPGNDPIHLWWIAPILLVALIPSLYKDKINSESMRSFSIFLLVFFLLLSVVNLMQLHSKDRIYFPEETVLSGMQAPLDESRFVGRSIELLTQYSTSNQISFDCADGLYATAGGSYLPVDKYFVNWGPARNPTKRDTSIIFICRTGYDEMLLKYPPNQFEVLHKIRSLSGMENYILTTKSP